MATSSLAAAQDASQAPADGTAQITQEQVQALLTLIQGVQLAQQRSNVFSLDEATELGLAVRKFVKPRADDPAPDPAGQPRGKGPAGGGNDFERLRVNV